MVIISPRWESNFLACPYEESLYNWESPQLANLFSRLKSILGWGGSGSRQKNLLDKKPPPNAPWKDI